LILNQKQNDFTMKQLLYLFIVGILAAGCKGSDPVAPADAATAIAGTYDLTEISEGAQVTKLPFTIAGITLSGTFEVTKKTASTVDINMTLKQTGQADDVTRIAGLEIKNNELYAGTNKVGTADGKTLAIELTIDGTKGSIKGTKR
jgi:hypothetical protein